MTDDSEDQAPQGAQNNPIGDPRAFRGYSTNLKKLAAHEKKSDFLPTFGKSFGGFVWEVAKIIIIALAIIKPIHYFLLQPFYVKGASMEPNFYNNEYLVVDQLSYRLHEPRRGDVIVLRNPFDDKEFFIKRVIGLPGERVVVSSGKVFVYNTGHPSGVELDETSYLDADVQTLGNIEITIGPTEYYVLGDHRSASLDSRSFGPIPRHSIVGRTAVRAWPVYRTRTFQTPEYPDLNSKP